jgi:hypothetical protein
MSESTATHSFVREAVTARTFREYQLVRWLHIERSVVRLVYVEIFDPDILGVLPDNKHQALNKAESRCFFVSHQSPLKVSRSPESLLTQSFWLATVEYAPDWHGCSTRDKMVAD